MKSWNESEKKGKSKNETERMRHEKKKKKNGEIEEKDKEKCNRLGERRKSEQTNNEKQKRWKKRETLKRL